MFLQFLFPIEDARSVEKYYQTDLAYKDTSFCSIKLKNSRHFNVHNVQKNSPQRNYSTCMLSNTMNVHSYAANVERGKTTIKQISPKKNSQIKLKRYFLLDSPPNQQWRYILRESTRHCATGCVKSVPNL